MRQTLRTLSIVACLAIANAANVYAEPVYTAPEAPFGFLHIGNKSFNKQLIGGVEATFSVNQMASFLSGNYSYPVKSNNRESEYEIYLPEDAPEALKKSLTQFFGNGMLAASWLEFQGLGDPVDGANLCHYALKGYFGKKPAPDVLIPDITIMMRRSLPTFAAMDTQADHEMHLPLERLADPISYKDKNYQLGEEDLTVINLLMAANLPIDANAEVDPPIVAHPSSVLRTYWDDKAKKMSAVLYVDEDVAYECDIPLAVVHE